MEGKTLGELEYEFEALLVKTKNVKLIETYTEIKIRMNSMLENLNKAMDLLEQKVNKSR